MKQERRYPGGKASPTGSGPAATPGSQGAWPQSGRDRRSGRALAPRPGLALAGLPGGGSGRENVRPRTV